MATPSAPLLALAAGVASHLFYFRIGEHHMLPVIYIQLFVLSCAGSTAALVHFTGTSIQDAFSTVSTLAGCWLAGVYGSLIIYRMFFHPLNNFPGLWSARLGDLWMSNRVKDLKAYKVFYDLHKQHGQFVRIGSNTLSITDPRIMQPAYSAQATVTKAEWYDGSAPHHSMHTTRDKGLHDRRRRVWAPAFSDKALREYETTVTEFNDKFIKKMGEFNGAPVDVSTFFNLYSFDVMGRLAFGKDYGMLESGKRHWSLDLLVEGMKMTGFRMPTWLWRTLLAIPGATAGHAKFLKFCTDELTWRVRNGKKDNNDITGWLLKAYANEPHPEDDPMLQGDSRLIIVAGSDTTSATLTNLFYHLATDLTQQKKLRDEVSGLAKGAWSDKDILNAKHLNGAINETLRLHPPVPSGVMRKAPKEGLQIGDTFVPGNTTFCTPMYPMGRDERIYTDAESFVPERWYSKPDMIKHADAFAPFSMGPFNCIGRNLARMELRTLTAQLLLNYEVALAPGEDGSRYLNDTLDHFTMSIGQLDLVFKPIKA